MARHAMSHTRPRLPMFSPLQWEPLQMTTPKVADGPRAVPQPVLTPLTRAAIFLVVTVTPGPESRAAIRYFCGDLAALVRSVGFRELEGGLSCIAAFGSEAWDQLFGQPRPAELRKFTEIHAENDT